MGSAQSKNSVSTSLPSSPRSKMSVHGEVKSPQKEVCYSDDETMKRRLLRKRQLEESEVYNAPETMAAKRRAVKEAAKTTPVPQKFLTKSVATRTPQPVSRMLTDDSLTFDDQIEPSEAAETPEQEAEEEGQGQTLLHAEEKGSNAAQSGVGAVQDVAKPVADQRDAAMVDVHMDADAATKVEASKNQPERQAQTIGKQGGNEKTSATAVKPRPKATDNLPMVLLEPRKWAKLSKQGARRSRRRLRRLMREEQALLSSQLQVA